MNAQIPIIYYNQLDENAVNKKYARVINQLAAGDFAGAEVKKMVNSSFYRARLDEKDRLLFTWANYQGKKRLLLLELITNHEYSKSRFLRGGVIPDESHWQPLLANDPTTPTELVYLNKSDRKVYALNKFISFDDEQTAIYKHNLPLALIGSAGSGKTALALEKMKRLEGRILYVSLSGYLVENARRIYFANGFENENQEVDFLSFDQYISLWSKPEGRAITFRSFTGWYQRFAQSLRFTDAHKLYEEFCGVITAQATDKLYLDLTAYLALGVRQSIFAKEERELVYAAFQKYISWLEEAHLYDPNMMAKHFLPLVKPCYDYVVVDEVQDITNACLLFILRSLTHKNNFLLTGDSNQIVHPNFFSWSAIKTFFFHNDYANLPISILHTNYRNSATVVQLSNKLLIIKQLRFGSIDRESNYLVKTNSQAKGEVLLLQANDKTQRDINQRTSQNAGYAIIVPKDEDKAEVAKMFRTPLLFSVHEAKGLEYENVILVNFVSGSAREYTIVAEGIDSTHLVGDEPLAYARPADKSDKEGEVYKFFINSLYVALTRALTNIFILERQPNHQLLGLLGLAEYKAQVNIQSKQSTREEWLLEAQRLMEQGKTEQAEAIRARILGYDYMSAEELARITALALDATKKETEVKRERKALYAYAVANGRVDWIEGLAELQFQRAMLYMKELRQTRKEYAKNCRLGRIAEMLPVIKKYGPDVVIDDNGATGLMLAIQHNQLGVVQKLLELKANPAITDKREQTAMYYMLNGYLKGAIKKQQGLTSLKTLSQYWYLLRPKDIKISINGKLANLPGHRQYTLLYWVLKSCHLEIKDTVVFKKANDPNFEINAGVFSIADVEHIMSLLPEEIFPAEKRRKTVISGLLSSHEVDSNNPYSKQLFKRIDRGFYTISPSLLI